MSNHCSFFVNMCKNKIRIFLINIYLFMIICNQICRGGEFVKNISIIVLLIILLILSFGYVAYDNFVVKKNLDNEISELKDEINLLKNFKNDVVNDSSNNSNIDSSDNSCPKYIEAEFYGELNEDRGSYIYNVKEVLKLHNDGKFQNYYENSGYAVEGTYEIINDKITLIITGGGSMGNSVTVGSTSTYEISNNCSTISKDGEVKTLTIR